MTTNEPLNKSAARPTGPAAKVVSDPVQLAAQINIEDRIAQADLIDDGSAHWGVVKYQSTEWIGWVATDLSFADAKNAALELSSNESDLDTEYAVNRQPDPDPAYQEVVIQGPVIRASSGTILINTQTQQNVFPRRQVTVRIPVVAAKPAPAPTALQLEEQAHAAFRETANAIIAELRTELEDALVQLTDLQSRPANPKLVAAPNDELTLAYLRTWYNKLSQADRDAQPLLIHDLVNPWHERSIIWTQIVRSCAGKVGQTPYEASPPKKVHAGQGAIQPKPAA